MSILQIYWILITPWVTNIPFPSIYYKSFRKSYVKSIDLDIFIEIYLSYNSCMTTHMLQEEVFLMEISTINRQNIVEEVYKEIIKKISNGDWEIGEKLPSENQLCDLFGVSRTSIRSALQKLSAQNIVEIRHGQGSFVSDFAKINILSNMTSVNLEMRMTNKEILDMLEFRETIEFKCIDLAVERASYEDIILIEKAFQKMVENQDDYKKYSAADFEFHLAMAKASKNMVLYQVMKNAKSFYFYLEELNRVYGVNEDSVAGHKRQLEMFKERDAEGIKNEIRMGVSEMIQKLNVSGITK